MSANRSSRRIRPSLWVFAGVFLAASAALAYMVLEPDAASAIVETIVSTDEARHPRRARDRDHVARRDRGASVSTGEYRHHDWSQPSELQRTIGLGLPGPSFWQTPPTRESYQGDPQSFAMWRSFHGAAQSEGEPELPFEPTATYATLVDATGDVPSHVESCDVRVLPVEAGEFNCVVRVMCDGQVLYPNPTQTAGYVPCEVVDGRPVRAVDDGNTVSDGDPLVDLDLEMGTVTVQDFEPDGTPRYSATLRINS